MNRLKLWVCAAGLTVGLTGCHSGPYDAAGYTTVEKNNRIYVFVPNSTEHQFFQKSGEIGKSVTRISAGPGRRTVTAEDAVNIDSYLVEAREKYPSPAPATR